MLLSNFSRILLCLAGGIAIAMGGLVIYSPSDFYVLNDIDLGGNVNLLSEIRAPAGALFTSGLVILLGAFMTAFTFTSTLLATLIYLSYGCSRLVGMAIDGVPTSSLVWATGIELVLGLVCLLCLCPEQGMPNDN